MKVVEVSMRFYGLPSVVKSEIYDVHGISSANSRGVVSGHLEMGWPR